MRGGGGSGADKGLLFPQRLFQMPVVFVKQTWSIMLNRLARFHPASVLDSVYSLACLASHTVVRAPILLRFSLEAALPKTFVRRFCTGAHRNRIQDLRHTLTHARNRDGMDAACTESYAAMRQLLNVMCGVAQRNAAVVSVDLRFKWKELWDLSCYVVVDNGCVYFVRQSSIPCIDRRDWFEVTRKSHVAWKWFSSSADAKPYVYMNSAGELMVLKPVVTRGVIWPVDGGTPPRSFPCSSREDASPQPLILSCQPVKMADLFMAVGCPFADSTARLFAVAGMVPTSVDFFRVCHKDKGYVTGVDFTQVCFPDERMAAALHEMRTASNDGTLPLCPALDESDD